MEAISRPTATDHLSAALRVLCAWWITRLRHCGRSTV